MKKLIIQIPCYNEEKTLGHALNSLPRAIKGIDTIEVLVINDGSTDKTVEVAKRHGVNHIIYLARNQGLAKAFMAGIEACVNAGADIIVNLDADNQYCVEDIPKLIAPILSGEAEMVIGARPIEESARFSFVKKKLEQLGSWVVRLASKTRIPDAPSGFRAISREAAMRLNVFNEYTYTIETIIQAGQTGMAVTSVPIRINKDLTERPSRLVRSILDYIKKSALTIIRIFLIYRPFRFFATLALILLGAGFLIGIRFMYFYFTEGGKGHIQSLILCMILLTSGSLMLVVGLLADLIAVNRVLLEKINSRTLRMEASSKDKEDQK